MLSVYKNGVDLSLKVSDYTRYFEQITLLVGEFLFIGYYKPIGDVYLEINNSSPVSNKLKLEVYNGSVWEERELFDMTNGLNNSGFLNWDKNKDWKLKLENTQSLFWARLSVLDNDITDLKLIGCNLVFSDDNDLKDGYPHILEFLPEGFSSFISYHQDVRNFIISKMQNKGAAVKSGSDYKLIDQFDLHNFNEIRQASKYLVLSRILSNQSDTPEDIWSAKADKFEKMYTQLINLDFLSVDKNNDGVKQVNEQSAVQSIIVSRI